MLVLDDESIIRESLSRYLEVAGYQVLPADSPDHAFDLLRRSFVNAAILDVRLPGGRSGLEVLEFVRLDEDRRDLPVIVLTSYYLSPEEEDIIRRHRGYVFYKPHGYGELVERLGQLLQGG